MADYRNRRYNPRKGTVNPKAIVDELHTIQFHEDVNTYGFYTNEGIYKESPSTIIVKDATSGIAMNEIARNVDPSANEFVPDYDDVDPYQNSGFCECHISDNGKSVKVTYKGTGLLTNTINYANLLAGATIPGTLAVSDLTLVGVSLNTIAARIRKSISRQAIMNMKRVTTLGGHPSYGAWTIAGDGNGVLVAYSIDKKIKRSTDNGATWADIGAHPWSSGAYIRQLFYANGKFIAAGESATLGYSTDGGASWTAVSPSIHSSSVLSRISYQNGLFLIGGIVLLDGSNHPCVITSPDGINWTTHTVSTLVTDPCGDILYRGGTYFAAVKDGYVYTSTDLTTWTKGEQWNTAGTGGSFPYMAQSSSTMIIMGSALDYTGGKFDLKYSKNNGSSWSNMETYGLIKDEGGNDFLSGTGALYAVSYDSNSDWFFLTSRVGTEWFTFVSPDGITWTRMPHILDINSATPPAINNPIFYSQGKFFAGSTTFILVGDGEVW